MLFQFTAKASDIYDKARIGTGYKTRVVCSGVLVSGKSIKEVENQELAGTPSELNLITVTVDRYNRKAIGTAPLFPPIIRRSKYLDDKLGCQPQWGGKPITAQVNFHGPYADEIWGEPDGSELDPAVLREAEEWAFAEKHEDKTIQTHAVLMVHKGNLVYERYASGFTRHQVLPGWSMTKSLTSTLVGRLVHSKALSVNAPIPVAEWAEESDARQKITWENLLQMTSGLEFSELYNDSLSDVNRMLSDSYDMAAYAANKPLQNPPGTAWYYSSGSTNIVTRALRTQFNSYQDYVDFPHRELFARIGMKSAVFEVDASGTYIGSTSAFATARDWAKYGQFILQGGKWNGEKLLPKGWTKWNCEPTAVSAGKYGAGFWSNGKDLNGTKAYPDLPSDTCVARGYHGQNILIIPSKDLVLVRLGNDPVPGTWSINEFGKRFLRAIKSAGLLP